jgi:uncharacterized protein (DUF1501 family)
MRHARHPGCSRRRFVQGALLGAGLGPLVLRRMAWAAPAERGKVLVCIFQRGAVDGLSMVVPYAEAAYYRERSSIAIARPGKPGGAVDLDGRFGLHPRLAPLKPLFAAGELAIVHAVGSTDPSRSHFEAQDYMENGTPGVATTSDGWLDRCALHARIRRVTPFRAVALTQELPLSLRGQARALALGDLRRYGLLGRGKVRAKLREGFAALYARSGASDPVLRAGSEALGAMHAIDGLDPDSYQPAHGAKYPNGRLGRQLMQAAELIKSDLGVRIAFADVGGWDTHAGQGGSEGRLARVLAELGQALAAFRRDLGSRMQDVVVLTMSEFGRTVAENGSGGTDHGHGNAFFVLGGPVRGKKVYGRWPGLAPADRYQGRDLAVTTDFRDVFAEVAMRHLGISNAEQILPGYAPKRFLGLLS